MAMAVGNVGTTAVLVVGSRNGLIYVYNMRGVSATFESVYREGATNDIWSNLYANDAAGDQMISDIGWVCCVYVVFLPFGETKWKDSTRKFNVIINKLRQSICTNLLVFNEVW